MSPSPSIQEYVDAVCKVAEVRRLVPAILYPVMLGCAYAIEVTARLIGIKRLFSPVRISKLIRSNDIHPGYLVDNGYPYRYTLEAAFTD